MESQREPDERSRKRHIEAEQRARAGKAAATEVEEHVQETLHGLCSCGITKPSCSSTRETEGNGRSGIA